MGMKEQDMEEKKLTYQEWQRIMEQKTVMPAWWWNEYMRSKAYKNYLNSNAINYGV
jgi:hypothetical protein